MTDPRKLIEHLQSAGIVKGGSRVDEGKERDQKDAARLVKAIRAARASGLKGVDLADLAVDAGLAPGRVKALILQYPKSLARAAKVKTVRYEGPLKSKGSDLAPGEKWNAASKAQYHRASVMFEDILSDTRTRLQRLRAELYMMEQSLLDED